LYHNYITNIPLLSYSNIPLLSYSNDLDWQETRINPANLQCDKLHNQERRKYQGLWEGGVLTIHTYSTNIPLLSCENIHDWQETRINPANLQCDKLHNQERRKYQGLW